MSTIEEKAQTEVHRLNDVVHPESESKNEEGSGSEGGELPKVADSLSTPVLIVVLVGGFERFAYYAVTTPWQNYIQNRPDSSVPGALGLGQSTATSISNAYMIFTALTPMPLAVLSDVYLGRFKTLILSMIIYLCGVLIIFATSLPDSLRDGAGGGGLAASMVLIGIGVGGVKATFSPFLGDQYSNTEPRVVTKKNNKQFVVDRGLTLQLIYNIFYWVTNVACLSTIPSTFLERIFGFWTAYLLGLCSLCVSLALLIATSSRLVRLSPQGNILVPAGKVLACAVRNGFKMNNTKAAHQISQHGHAGSWTDEFVDEISMTLRTCRILFSFVAFYLCVNQMMNNFISQAGQMRLDGVPNDMIPSLAGIACVVLGPIVQATYGLLAKRNIIPSATLLITLAFIFCGGAMAYASGVQDLIYSSPPCYNHPRACGTSAPNDISVWIQVPTYVIAAIAEIFGFVTVSEYAFSNSPRDAKAIVQALSQLSACLGSVLGLAISPLARDPKLVAYYASLAGVMVVAAAAFWWLFTKFDTGKKSDE